MNRSFAKFCFHLYLCVKLLLPLYQVFLQLNYAEDKIVGAVHSTVSIVSVLQQNSTFFTSKWTLK